MLKVYLIEWCLEYKTCSKISSQAWKQKGRSVFILSRTPKIIFLGGYLNVVWNLIPTCIYPKLLGREHFYKNVKKRIRFLLFSEFSKKCRSFYTVNNSEGYIKHTAINETHFETLFHSHFSTVIRI